MILGAAGVAAAMAAWADGVEKRRDAFDALDALAGDGDHGTTAARGARAAADAANAAGPGATAGDALDAAGRACVAAAGGASGPLLGSVLLALGAAHGDLAIGFAAAVERVGALGRSAPGDRTLLDALAPAATAITGGGSPTDVAAAAAAGAEGTVHLAARVGRAAHVEGGGIGHVDPGAATTALLVAALVAHAR
jgi:dihydroxyacetone kinase-like protein